jgi:hypothetical protein
MFFLKNRAKLRNYSRNPFGMLNYYESGRLKTIFVIIGVPFQEITFFSVLGIAF